MMLPSKNLIIHPRQWQRGELSAEKGSDEDIKGDEVNDDVPGLNAQSWWPIQGKSLRHKVKRRRGKILRLSTT